MKAYVCGQAAAAVVVGPRPELRLVGRPPVPARSIGDALRALDGCGYVEAVDLPSLEEIDSYTRQSWAVDRCLRLLILILDSSEPIEVAVECAECLDELVRDEAVARSVRNNLAAVWLNNFIEMNRIASACAATPNASGLINWFLSAQPQIRNLVQAFASIPDSAFAGMPLDAKDRLRQSLVVQGAFQELLDALIANTDLAFQKLAVTSRNRTAQAAISHWFGRLQPSLKGPRRPPPDIHPEPDLEDYETFGGQSNPAAFGQVMRQQREIITCLRTRQIDRARRLVTGMVEAQRATSNADQIAKSLCSMAQQAKLLDIPDLQMEWARLATEENPADPRTHGQLADAFIEVGDLGSAELSLNQVEAHGGHVFAASGRARIMRIRGEVESARRAFLAVADLDGPPHEKIHARIGAAECLRDLGKGLEAVQEFTTITKSSPTEGAAWAGLAAALVDVGQFYKAFQNFGRATTHKGGPHVEAGRARALRLSGDLDNAESAYRKILDHHPDNREALYGLGKTLEARGELVDAALLFDSVIEKFPYVPDGIIGKGSVLRRQGKLESAVSLYRSAIDRFPYSRPLLAGLARVLRARGEFGEAIATLDALIARTPFDWRARTERASVLHRTGLLLEALDAYEQIIRGWPHWVDASLGKAAVLLHLERLDEALALLPEGRARTRKDWRGQTLRALVIDRQGYPRRATKLLLDVAQSCPFAPERRQAKDALASLEIGRSEFIKARQRVEAEPDRYSNIIAFHALAAGYRPGKARQYLDTIQSEGGPADIIELAEEIARRHDLIPDKPLHVASWVREKEWVFLLTSVG